MKLDSWSLHPYRLPYRRKITWAYAAEDSGDYALLRIDAGGVAGVAETVVKPSRMGFSFGTLRTTLDEVVLPLLKDLNLEDAAGVQAALARVPENRAAKTLVDNACWTLRAAAAGKPLWKLWNADPAVEVSWMVTRQPPAQMAAEAAEMCARHGFRTLKVKGGQGRDIDLQAIAAVRAAVGPEVELSGDANGAYGAGEAASYVEALKDAGITVIEDPCPLLPNRAFEALQEEAGAPLLVDFACTSSQDATLFLDRGAQALMAKPARAGLSEARAIDAVGAQRGAAVAFGMYYESALGAAVTLPLANALGAKRILPAEQFFLFLAAQVSHWVPEVKNGKLKLPDEADVSRLIDWSALQKAAI